MLIRCSSLLFPLMLVQRRKALLFEGGEFWQLGHAKGGEEEWREANRSRMTKLKNLQLPN
jgi:hypothetical protein